MSDSPRDVVLPAQTQTVVNRVADLMSTDPELGLELCEQSLAHVKTPDEKYALLFLAASCLQEMDCSMEELTSAYLAAWEVAPRRAEPLYHLANVLFDHGHFNQARLFAEEGLTILDPQREIPLVDHDVYRWKLQYLFGEINFALQRWVDALIYYTGAYNSPYLPPDSKEFMWSKIQTVSVKLPLAGPPTDLTD
jgi:tetratricopeptide (TPR) repeat protein